eukprot:COSAG02_NODE_257_length_26838_cov_118.324844_11_plen_542_part_00
MHGCGGARARARAEHGARSTERGQSAMASSSPAASPTTEPKKKISAEWRTGQAQLPALTDDLERAAIAGLTLALAQADPELTHGALAKELMGTWPMSMQQGKAERAIVNLEYCEDNDKEFPLTGRIGEKPGPPGRKQSSPAAAARAKDALREAGTLRDAVAVFNEKALEEGKQPIGEQNIQLLSGLVASGEDGLKCVRRPRQPLLTDTNRRDRLSMAKVINSAKRKRGPDKWLFEKDTIHGDQFMVELGSGDIETKTQWIRDDETPRPLLVVKFPAKVMINAFVGWNFKSPLVWCNKHGSMKGEATWNRKFFAALEDLEGECLDFGEGVGEACGNCANCLHAMSKAGHSFQEVLESVKPGLIDDHGEPVCARPDGPATKLWMDAAPCQWTNAAMEWLESECQAPRATPARMQRGEGRVLFSPTHKLKRTPGGSADGTVMDSGVIRHFKLLLRKRLAKEDGGRRMVLDKERMFEICCEVWDSIPIEDLRPYFTKVTKTWEEIEKEEGRWVGWGKKGKRSEQSCSSSNKRRYASEIYVSYFGV